MGGQPAKITRPDPHPVTQSKPNSWLKSWITFTQSVPDVCPLCGSPVVWDGYIDRFVCIRWPGCPSVWT